MRNLLNILLALDAFLFSLICWGNVYPGEYASSAAYRLDMQGRWQGWIFRPLIDLIFGHLHCYDSWLMQSNMTQSPKNIELASGTMNMPNTERRKSTLTEEDRTAIAFQLGELLREAPGPHLSDDEQRWVRMAIRREAQSIAFRQAVIEKSLAGLLWAAIAFAGYLLMEFMKFKGYKP